MAIGQYTATPFNHQHPFPPDLRMKFPSLNDRDSLSPVIRWEGMIVYVDDQEKHYKLIGGTDNANWQEFQTFDAENYYTKTEVDNLLSDLGLNTGDAVLDAGQFNRSDATTVTITDANWRINDNEFTVTDTLTTNGTPTAGNKRWDLYTGDSSGDLNYISGTEDPNPTKPAVPAGSLLIWEELRLDDGTSETNPTPTPAQDFPPNRYYTAVTSNSTGLYAKVFEITVSGVNNYGFILDYQMPASASDGSTGRAGRLIVNITCASGVIDEIKMETVDGNSASGDWVILETTGTNTVQLFHKSTHFWGRVQFRVTFANSLINDTHFISDESYAALPTADNQYDSTPVGDGKYVRFDINNQSLNLTQRQNSRTNIQALAKDVDDTKDGALTFRDSSGNPRIILAPEGGGASGLNYLSLIRSSGNQVLGISTAGRINLQSEVGGSGQTVLTFANVGINVFRIIRGGLGTVGANIPTAVFNQRSYFIDGLYSDKVLVHPDAVNPNESATLGQVNSAVGDYIPLTQKAAANGVASLDGGGKIPATQLPNSVMELQGEWDASTNTPTLTDGTGNPGDVWECVVAGTVDFGSGNIEFNVGDWAVYGADNLWYKSLNSNEITGVKGDAEGIFRTGNVNLTPANIGALPTSAISGTTNTIPKFTAANTIGDSQITDNGTTLGLTTNWSILSSGILQSNGAQTIQTSGTEALSTQVNGGNFLIGNIANQNEKLQVINSGVGGIALYRDFDVSGGSAAIDLVFGAMTGSTPMTGSTIRGTLLTGGNESDLRFITRIAGSTSERMRLNEAGNFLIGTNTDTGEKLQVNGSLKVSGTKVNFANLPTTDPLVAGDLWNDAGTVKISAG